MVSYVGSTAARALLHDHELWLSPESLDSRSSFLQKQGLPAKVSDHSTFNLCHQHLCFYMLVMAHICWTLQHSFYVHGVQHFCPISGRGVKAISRLWCDKNVHYLSKSSRKISLFKSVIMWSSSLEGEGSRNMRFGLLGCCLKLWLMYML